MQPALCQGAPLPSDETDRLLSLHSFDILDSERELRFDRMVLLATELLKAPIALVSLVDHDRQWFKAKVGIDATETPRNLAFCAYAILGDSVFYVPDATQDDRFAMSPLVLGPPFIRTYVGAPLITRDGFRLGTLCVIYPEVTTVTQEEREQLERLAAITVDEIELRRALAREMETRRAAEAVAAAKSRFLANMSHEIRTPLNGVMGMLELMCEAESKDEFLEYATTARKAGRDLMSILNDILDLSKLDKDEMKLATETVDLEDLVERTKTLFSGLARTKQLELATSLDPTLPRRITSDGARLQQIVSNLVGNALKFTETGTVRLELCANTVDARPGLLIRVTDSGIGIPADALPLIFERFTQVDESGTRRFGGTGLGLAICKELAELMGGSIDVESSPGYGTTFRVSLPLTHAAPEADPHPVCEPGGEERCAPTLRVLVAEDNDINLKLITILLEKRGYTVTPARNGIEAVQTASNGEFDVILMDDQMPQMNGIEATRMIRNSSGPARHIPIVAVTANSMPADRERYENAGMNGFVLKPIRPDFLFPEIERCAALAQVSETRSTAIQD